MTTLLDIPPESDALRANLLVTAVAEVTVPVALHPLREVVAGYAGIQRTLDRLLLEISHPFRNWPLILPELRGFVLKHAPLYAAHPRGADCFELFFQLFFQPLAESDKERVIQAALEGVSAVLEKLARALTLEQLEPFRPLLEGLLERLATLPDEQLLLLSQSHYPIKRTITLLRDKQARQGGGRDPVGADAVRRLALRALGVAYRYWLAQPDAAAFIEPGVTALDEVTHASLARHLAALEVLETHPDDPQLLPQLVALPSYLDIVRHYRHAAEQLGRLQEGAEANAAAERLMESRRLRFLFHVMDISGLIPIHEEILREINRSLVHLVQLAQRTERVGELRQFLVQAFAFLKANVVNFPHTALQIIGVLGAEVFQNDNSRLVETFLEQAVRFGFQLREVRGVGSDWQVLANPAHLVNIRVWLGLIERQPQWCSTLLSALIINLRVAGTCIRDTDLFQKEVTRLLNSEVAPVYNMVKQFTRQLPVYFNEIGAEGELRNVSTELDEITRRRDPLIHFLRKQCHVESTNLTVLFVRAIIRFWRGGEKAELAPFIPLPTLEEVAACGPCFDQEHQVTADLFHDQGFRDEEALLDWPLVTAERWIMARTGVSERAKRRVFLLVWLYQLLHLKYNLGDHGLEETLQAAAQEGLPGMEALQAELARGVEGPERLTALLTALESLQGLILSRQEFEAREEVYQKRHIAVDIPSVYGRYQEPKFDALSLSFRLENLARVQLEKLLERIPDEFITQAAFYRVAKYLRLFLRALAVDGITSRALRNHLDILERALELNQFSFPQFLDLCRGFTDGVREVVYTYYTSQHRDNLAVIIHQMPREALLPRYAALVNDDPTHSLERVSEAFLRDLISESMGLQSLDNFIARVQKILLRQEHRLGRADLDLLMTYDPAKLFCPIHAPMPRTRNLIHLGGKGFNLVQMAENGIPVPPGVVLTTEFFRCHTVIRKYPPAWKDFMEQLVCHVAHMEQETGKSFGDESNPLLLSVRSGALISMPGMMQTVYNVGINRRIVDGLIERTMSPFFAWDTYRRFIQSWAMAFGLGRNVFNQLMHAAKRRHGVRKKQEFSAEQMRELAEAYRLAAEAHGVVIPNDPLDQLLGAVRQVLESWDAPKSLAYRHIMNIADEWGTAVVLQAMVFGNLHQQSGTGVLFTAHPHRKLDRVLLWGDYTPGNQGEDIVGGLVSTFPISLEQCQYDGRQPETSLELRYPRIYAELLHLAQRLVYEFRWNSQEMEFTFDGPAADNLFILQTRDMVTGKNRQAVLLKGFRKTPELASHRLARGLGVSGGALCGLAVFNREQILALKREHPKVPLILIRYDTVPDDIQEISEADGLLTARGGQTSHAAIVAARLEKTCVVGCEDLIVREHLGQGLVAGRLINVGDAIAIDGHTGLVLEGWHETESSLLTAGEIPE